MRKGDGTEMGEVVHSTLMPSLLSDQILREAKGHRMRGHRYHLKKSSGDAK